MCNMIVGGCTNAAIRRAVARVAVAAWVSISFASCPSPCTAGGDGSANATYDGLSVEQWILSLQDPDKQVRRRAAYVLGQMGPAAAAAVPALAKAADDSQLEVGWYALDALGRIGPGARSAVPEILRILQKSTRYQTLRLNAVRALGKIGPDSRAATATLEQALVEADAQLRIAAAVSLWQIDRRDAALTALAGELENSSADAALAAAVALQEIGADATAAIRPLIKAMGSPDADVRRAAGRALGQFDMEAVPLLVKAAQHPDRFDLAAVVRTLGWIGDARRTGVLHARQTTVDQYRAAAAPLQKEVVPVLLGALGAEEAEVREAAVTSLARTGTMSIPALLTTMQKQSGKAREGAIAALAELERYLPPDAHQLPGVEWINEVSRGPLLAAMQHADRSVRRAAFRLFDTLKLDGTGNDVAAVLRAGLRDEDVMVRRYAARAQQRGKPQDASKRPTP